MSMASIENPEIRVGKVGNAKIISFPVKHDLTKSPKWNPGDQLPMPLKKIKLNARAYIGKFLGEDSDRWVYSGLDIISDKNERDTRWFYYIRYRNLDSDDFFWLAVTMDGQVFPLIKAKADKQ
ncbi:hypothetical protein NT6N_04270 [Oceaniferula spumae]|uniref:Uncharacterized protein n=1 Tax=Oceaniferula spumae TaxID=2979115 RepID=A0AAT9FHC6_9BACT